MGFSTVSWAAAVILLFALPSRAGAVLEAASLSTITTDIATNVGGGRVEVIRIIGPGMDPHEFQPSPGDVKKIVKADLVLITGKHAEGYLTKLEESAGGDGKFVDTGASVPSLKLEEDGRMVADPHWWHSIDNMMKAAEVVKERFIQADPGGRAVYERNAADYLARLNELKAWAMREVARLPRDKRKLVTSHDAFQYFAKDFGFTIYAIEGVSTGEEPSSKKIAALIEMIRSNGVKAVFFESVENPKVVAEIVRETGAKVGGALFADGLGDKQAATYADMVRHNITTIVDGLK